MEEAEHLQLLGTKSRLQSSYEGPGLLGRLGGHHRALAVSLVLTLKQASCMLALASPITHAMTTLTLRFQVPHADSRAASLCPFIPRASALAGEIFYDLGAI